MGLRLRLEVDVGDEEVFSKLREKFSDKKSQQDDKRLGRIGKGGRVETGRKATTSWR